MQNSEYGRFTHTPAFISRLQPQTDRFSSCGFIQYLLSTCLSRSLAGFCSPTTQRAQELGLRVIGLIRVTLQRSGPTHCIACDNALAKKSAKAQHLKHIQGWPTGTWPSKHFKTTSLTHRRVSQHSWALSSWFSHLGTYFPTQTSDSPPYTPPWAPPPPPRAIQNGCWPYLWRHQCWHDVT